MLPRLHIFQLPCILKAWRADRKACICLWLSMCPRKSIFSTQAAGCTLQFHCAHWAVWKNQSISFRLHSLWEAGLQSLSTNKQSASDTILPYRGEKKKKKRKKPTTLLASAAETLEALIVRRFSLKSNLTPLALHHYGTFAVLYLCFTPTY